MSFSFQWPQFSDQFHADAISMLESALNKGNKPPVIAGKIEVVELHMGTEPPELEIRDIGDLTVDQFRGIFRLSYAGDAYIVLRTRVQANPLNHKQPDIHQISGSRGILAAHQPLVVPMLLRLSNFRLNSYVVLVVSKQKGITLVFKTDPLQNVDINSTFDSIAVIQSFIQREIEEQLRQMFREDLPSIIHRLSQQWVKAKVEAPYLDKGGGETRLEHPKHMPEVHVPTVPFHDRMPLVGLQPSLNFRQSLNRPGIGSRRVTSALSVASSDMRRSVASHSPQSRLSSRSQESLSATTEESHDPSYGLRPDGIPAKSVYGNFGRLFSPTRGLGDLAEEMTSDGYDTDEASFDVVEWEDAAPFSDAVTAVSAPVSMQDFETVPAVGGGTITRPRILHSQSNVLPPREAALRPSTFSSSRAMSRLSLSPTSPESSFPHPYTSQPRWSSAVDLTTIRNLPNEGPFSPIRPGISREPSRLRRELGRGGSLDSRITRASRSSSNITTPPSSDPSDVGEDKVSSNFYAGQRRRSLASSPTFDAFTSATPLDHDHHAVDPDDAKIILRPSHNHSVSQLSMLSNSYHTLSPYARSLQHFAVRSGPPRGTISAERGPVRGKRKRTYRLGNQKTPKSQIEPPTHLGLPSQVSPPPSPRTPPSEFDVSDLDRYFRSRDDLPPPSTPDIHPSHIRRRTSRFDRSSPP